MANLGPLGCGPAFSKTRIGWPRFKIISRQCWIMDQDTLYKISSRCEFWSAYWGLRNQKSEILFCPVQWPWWLNKSVSLVLDKVALWKCHPITFWQKTISCVQTFPLEISFSIFVSDFHLCQLVTCSDVPWEFCQSCLFVKPSHF